MSALDRALAELKKAEERSADESLTTPAGTDAFHYGEAVGRLRGLKYARAILERCMQESAPKTLERHDHAQSPGP